MSFTAAIWVVTAGTTALLSVRNAAWAVALYMLTFFAAPHLWWWGRDLPDLRYSFLSGFVLMAAVVLNRSEDAGHRFTFVHAAVIGMVINVTFVHFFLASVPSISIRTWIEVLKFALLFFLIWSAIRDKRDFRIVMLAIALGAAYIGYEVSINERGDFKGSRLEGVGAPGADSANSLACLMLATLPLTGSCFVSSTRWSKLLVVFSAPLALNVLLLCNSRGAFLGLLGAAFSFMLIARGATRKRALQTLGLGAVTLYLLLGDAKILDRFSSTFVGSEDRDNSAASRLEFWKAGLAMLSDYPLGDGGNSFKYVRGGRYLAEIADVHEDRSLHNGYLTEATSWGVQGLALHLTFLSGAMFLAYRTSNRCRLKGDTDDALIGVCVIVAGAGFMIHSLFGSFLGSEWGYWIAALLVRYSELYQPAQAVATDTIPMAA